MFPAGQPRYVFVLAVAALGILAAYDARGTRRWKSTRAALLDHANQAAAVGMSAVLLPAGKAGPLQAHLRSTPLSRPLEMTAYTIKCDGKAFAVSAKRTALTVGQTDFVL